LTDAGSRSNKMEAKFHRAHAAIRKDCKWHKDPNENQKNKR
jgi:hypothetical protein